MSEIKARASVKLLKKVDTAICLLPIPAPSAQVQLNWPILSRSGLTESNSPKCPASQLLEGGYGHWSKRHSQEGKSLSWMGDLFIARNLI